MNNSSFVDFHNVASLEKSQLSKLLLKKRKLTPITYSEIPSYGNVMGIDEFVSNCKSGGFINYDGFGSYIKDGKMSNIDVHPSDITKHNYIFPELLYV